MKLCPSQPSSEPIQSNGLFLGFIPPNVLRLIIGLIGMLLPGILVVGTGFTILGSISAYYYSVMRWWFMGFFVVLGWMLIAYKGFPGSYDDAVSIAAGVFSILLAVVPTSPSNQPRDLVGWLHVIFTLLFFLSLIYMALCLFTLNPAGKSWKKAVYRLCGVVMLIAVLGIVFFEVSGLELFDNPTFWFEVVGFEFFGFSWLVKSVP